LKIFSRASGQNSLRHVTKFLNGTVQLLLSDDSFIQTTSIVLLQVHYYSEAQPTQHGYCVGVSRRSTTGNCEWRTCPRSLHGG